MSWSSRPFSPLPSVSLPPSQCFIGTGAARKNAFPPAHRQESVFQTSRNSLFLSSDRDAVKEGALPPLGCPVLWSTPTDVCAHTTHQAARSPGRGSVRQEPVLSPSGNTARIQSAVGARSCVPPEIGGSAKYVNGVLLGTCH